MKELLILSGKGGTGKTTVASAFIALSKAKAYADCDVDAPNLHIINGHDEEPTITDYYGLPKARINEDVCIGCGKCMDVCRFNAIKKDGGKYRIDDFACEGCSVCEYVCPVSAINMHPEVAGDLKLYKRKNEIFSAAQLRMGSGTSGKLVTEVKKQMRVEAKKIADFAIIDGSPGIGCPVIASLAGADMVLIVAEPSVSGISDMERILDTAANFGVKSAVCINKADINIENSDKIEEFCQKRNISFMGRIPFDQEAVKAVNSCQTVVERDCPSGRAIKRIYENVRKEFIK